MFGSEQLVAKIIGNGKDSATIKMVQPKFSPGLGEIDGKMISTWNLGILFFIFFCRQLVNIDTINTQAPGNYAS
jgi:hypothetical protein